MRARSGKLCWKRLRNYAQVVVSVPLPLMVMVVVSYEEHKVQRDNKHQRRNRFNKSYEFYGTLILVAGAAENLRVRP